MTAPMVVGPRDVAGLRVHLLEQWRPGRLFHQVMVRAEVIHNEAQMIDPVALAMLDAMAPGLRAANASRWEAATLTHASLWWVSPAMGDLLLAAMHSVPDDVLVADLPPLDRTGFVVLAEPLPLHGTEQEILDVHAFAFGPSELPSIFPGRPEPLMEGHVHAVSFSFYERANLDDGLSQTTLNRVGPTLTDALERGELNVTVEAEDRVSLHGDIWIPLGRSDWPVADPLGRADLIVSGEWHQASYVEDRKLYAAFVTLLHQEGIAQTTTEWPARPVVRRVQRAGLPREAASVRVVRLREVKENTTHEHDGEDRREWSHRWIVQGHWRNARVGAGRTQRRLVWVSPHVKGPADKPLATPTVVKAWVR